MFIGESKESHEWSRSAQYQIYGKAAGIKNIDQIRLMLPSLLEDKFKLRFHIETQETPVYALVIAEGGAVIEPAKDENGNAITTIDNSLSKPCDESFKLGSFRFEHSGSIKARAVRMKVAMP